jgi:hypothetical protein
MLSLGCFAGKHMVVPSQTIRQVGAEHAGHTENGSAVIVPNRCSQFLGALAEDAERPGRRRDVILAVLRQLGCPVNSVCGEILADNEALAKGRFRLQLIHIPEGCDISDVVTPRRTY